MAGDVIRTNGFSITGNGSEISTGSYTTASRWLGKKVAGGSYNEVIDVTPAEGSDTIPLYAIGTNETIEILRLNETVLSDAQQNCFWYCRPIIHKDDGGQYSILNQVENDLIFEQDPSDASGNTYYHILEEGEVFIYPSEDGYSLFTLGSGTKLQVVFPGNGQFGDLVDVSDIFGRPTYKLARQNVVEGNIIDLEELQNSISTQDINNFLSSYNWNVINFSRINLHIVESSISSYVEGDRLLVSGNAGITLSNGEWKDASDLTSLQIENGMVKGISPLTHPKIRAILTLNGNANDPQKIEDNQDITLLYYDAASLDDDGYYDSGAVGAVPADLKARGPIESSYIQLNTMVDDYTDIILRVMHYEENEYDLRFNDRYELPCSSVDYDLYPDSTADSSDAAELYNLIHSASLTKSASRGEYVFTWAQIDSIVADKGNKLTIDVPSDLDLYINVFNNRTGKTVLEPVVQGDDAGTITLDFTELAEQIGGQDDGTTRIYITVPRVLHINPVLQQELDKGGNNVMQGILNTISTNYTNFDYLAPLSNSKIISSYNQVNSFLDYNNVYNPLTIGKIDFKECNFNIVASSRK